MDECLFLFLVALASNVRTRAFARGPTFQKCSFAVRGKLSNLLQLGGGDSGHRALLDADDRRARGAQFDEGAGFEEDGRVAE